MSLIYHITTKQQWIAALENGHYVAPSLATEGFIHCSEANQVKGVLERYYAEKSDLLKLVIDTEKLSAPLKYELAPSINQEFPHIYGEINTSAVIDVESLD